MVKWSGKPDNEESEKLSRSQKVEQTYDKFADMIIEALEKFQGDWEKPWFTEGAMVMPKSIYGRSYNGMNSLLLMLHTQDKGYTVPVFATSSNLMRLNYEKTEKKKGKGKGGKPGERVKDAEGNNLPFVSILKGEKSFPVILAKPFAVNEESKEFISKEKYDKLPDEEKEKYTVRFKQEVYLVFNIDQTNLKETRPELYQKLINENTLKKPEIAEGETFSYEPIDRMIKDNLYICPIKPTYGDDAHFSISKNEIVIPQKEQFKDGEAFYSNLLHEMAHATGHESQLNRIKPASFGSKEYAKEELVAELTSALVASSHGMDKHLKDDSVAYLSSWLQSLKEEPSYIKNVLYDMKQASNLIETKISEVENLIKKEKNGEAIDIRENDGLDDGIDDISADGPEEANAIGADKKQGEAEKHEEEHSEKKQNEEQEATRRSGGRRR